MSQYLTIQINHEAYIYDAVIPALLNISDAEDIQAVVDDLEDVIKAVATRKPERLVAVVLKVDDRDPERTHIHAWVTATYVYTQDSDYLMPVVAETPEAVRVGIKDRARGVLTWIQAQQQ